MTRKELEKMTFEQREALIKEMQADVLSRLEALFGKAPAPVEPPVEPVKPKPKAKRSKRIERFDDLSDDAQISQLRGLWGAA